jgi:hypothetical protein
MHWEGYSMGRNFGIRGVLLTIIVLGIASGTRGQTLVVTSGGQTVNQGNTLSINTIPNMPNLVLSVSGGTSCDTVSYSVYVEYIDQAGYATSSTYSAQNYPGDAQVTIDWFGVLEGGNATITWGFDGVNEPSFSFFINGSNASSGAVDAYISSGPWFIRNLVAAESSYKQYDVYGYPLWGTPDGIGLMQLEPPYRASLDQDYWGWSTNVADGLNLLNGKQSAAYSHWTTQINFAQMDGGPNPPALYGTYCAFQQPQNGGDYYGDADWIHYYNSNYYTQWVRPSPPNPGYWNMDGYNHSGYVQRVCNAVPQ